MLQGQISGQRTMPVSVCRHVKRDRSDCFAVFAATTMQSTAYDNGDKCFRYLPNARETMGTLNRILRCYLIQCEFLFISLLQTLLRYHLLTVSQCKFFGALIIIMRGVYLWVICESLRLIHFTLPLLIVC